MDAAAMVFRAARSQDMKVEDARKHQMFLAKQRILARKQKVKAKEGEEEEKMEETKEGLPQISSSVEATGQLRDSIIELVEQKHGLEREIFMDIVQKLSNLEVSWLLFRRRTLSFSLYHEITEFTCAVIAFRTTFYYFQIK